MPEVNTTQESNQSERIKNIEFQEIAAIRKAIFNLVDSQDAKTPGAEGYDLVFAEQGGKFERVFRLLKMRYVPKDVDSSNQTESIGLMFGLSPAERQIMMREIGTEANVGRFVITRDGQHFVFAVNREKDLYKRRVDKKLQAGNYLLDVNAPITAEVFEKAKETGFRAMRELPPYTAGGWMQIYPVPEYDLWRGDPKRDYARTRERLPIHGFLNRVHEALKTPPVKISPLKRVAGLF